MATKIACATCGKGRGTSKCEGCSQIFCFNHFVEHRQELHKQVDEIIIHHDLVRHMLSERIENVEAHPLIEQIDRWEQKSIRKIQKTAEQARQSVLTHSNDYMQKIDRNLKCLTEQLRNSREDDDIIETDVCRWRQELEELTEQLNKPLKLAMEQNSTALIHKIEVTISEFESTPAMCISELNWQSIGITVAGGNGNGIELNQLSGSYGVCVDDNETVYIADTSNHRIVQWKKGATIGKIIAGGNDQGYRDNQLHSPSNVILDRKTDSLIIADSGNQRVVRWSRSNCQFDGILISNVACWGLAMDDEGYLYVSDIDKHEVRRYRLGDQIGTIVAGGHGKGKHLDQLNRPYYITVDKKQSVYVSEYSNNRVTKWIKGADQGVIVAGSDNRGDGLTQLSYPYGLAVDTFETICIADFNNHRVISWRQEATQGSIVVGGNGPGNQANQLTYPVSVAFDSKCNLYVVDFNNQRVQKFLVTSISNKL